MHIGIDLDNTILDATSAHLRYFNEESGKSFTPDDVDDFYLYRMYGWSKEERDRIYFKLGHHIHKNSLPLPGAMEVLQRLYGVHTITFITARPALFHNVTVEWLHFYHVRYHQIAFTEEKFQECQRAGVDVLIDDGPHYAEEFVRMNKPVILYDQPYNRNVRNPLIYRAHHWQEVQKHIEMLETAVNQK